MSFHKAYKVLRKAKHSRIGFTFQTSVNLEFLRLPWTDKLELNSYIYIARIFNTVKSYYYVSNFSCTPSSGQAIKDGTN